MKPGKRYGAPSPSPGGQASGEPGRGTGKAAPADAGQPDSRGNEESDEEVHVSARVEKVWIPHSSFVPPHRPDLGLLGSDGSEVHGWHPMLRYPSSYCGRQGIPFAFA